MELIWDECWRSTINYGRKGLPIQALSALDLALWDALGKLRKEPVYAMLGGKTKARLPTVSLNGCISYHVFRQEDVQSNAQLGFQVHH